MTLLLMALAAHYLTYLVVDSDFPPIELVRATIISKVPDGSSISYLLTCYWCVSAYTGLAVVGAVDLFQGLASPVVWWLAVAVSAAWLCLLRDWVDMMATRTRGQWLKEMKEYQNGGS